MAVRTRSSWQRDPRAGMLVIVMLGGIGTFALFAVALVAAPWFVRLDVAASEAVRSISFPGSVAMARFATSLGNFWPMTVFTLISTAYLWYRRRKPEALGLVVAMASGAVLGAVLKVLIARARPVVPTLIPLPDSYSLPSGHALSSAIFFGWMAVMVLFHVKKLRRGVAAATLFVASAIVIGLSRVYLGVHFLGDVFASWFLAAGWMALVVLVTARWGASAR